MTHTDTQLKQALAKMLPEKLAWHNEGLNPCDDAPALYWINEAKFEVQTVLDTELLHLCWLVEKTLTMGQRLDYLNHLDNRQDDDWLTCHATWQQRVIALAKVKGTEIV